MVLLALLLAGCGGNTPASKADPCPRLHAEQRALDPAAPGYYDAAKRIADKARAHGCLDAAGNWTTP